MIEINLIPDVKREFLQARAVRNAVITLSVIITSGVVGLAVVLGLVLGGQLVAEAVQSNEIKKSGAELTSVEDLNKTVTIQQQLNKVDEQHASKMINSRLFDVMTTINPPAPNDIKISVLKLDPELNTVSIEGSAANGYLALEVFKKTIMNTSIQVKNGGEEESIPLASDIVTGETTFGENAEGQRVLRFSFSFTYPDELFTVSQDPVSVTTPSGRVDVTDSKVGVPISLFSERATDIGGGN